MSGIDHLRSDLFVAYEENPREAVTAIARALTDFGCPVLIVALTGEQIPVVRNSINIDQAGEAIAEQVIVAVLCALGLPRQQASGYATLALPHVMRYARQYAAQYAARARAAAAAGRR